MKIEKLTENKIRVIVKPSDLDIKNLDIRSFMTKALKEQNFFTNMLWLQTINRNIFFI